MKKQLLLLSLGCIATVANGQLNNVMVPRAQADKTRVKHVEAAAPHAMATRPNVQAKNAAKTTASVFWGPETFGSGTSTSLPTGWTASSLPAPGGGTWKWTNTASTSTFSMGAMHSTSASDGWMIFDSDLIGAASGGSPSGYLQSPAITACATESSVRLNFENYFRNFYDSCSVWVSTGSSFAPGTYAVYPVYYNNSTPVNVSTPNTSVVHVNITGAAAMQPTIYIRFVYYGAPGGSYSWMIDDMTLSSMDAVDLGVNKSAAIYYSGSANAWASFGSKPASMMDTVFPLTLVNNFGSTAFPTASVNAKIFQGSSLVYDHNATVNVPVDALDSVADFVAAAPGYFSSTPGTYTVAFNVSPSGDADNTNDADTAMFTISDTTWSQNAPGAKLVGSQFVYYATPSPYAFSPATGFSVSPDRKDTITSISVAFGDTTVAGQVVGVQLYHFDGSNWTYDGETEFRALADAEISTSSTVNYATFKVDMVATGGYLVLDGGASGTQYAAVVKGQSNTAPVAVLTSTTPGPQSVIGYTAYSDTSFNDGGTGTQFGQTGLPYANSSVPLIRLNFGIPPTIGVADINKSHNVVGRISPNPANNQASLPFTLANDGEITVSVCNALGQEVSRQSMLAKAGQPSRFNFNTSMLPAGIYIYTASTTEGQATGKFIVAH